MVVVVRMVMVWVRIILMWVVVVVRCCGVVMVRRPGYLGTAGHFGSAGRGRRTVKVVGTHPSPLAGAVQTAAVALQVVVAAAVVAYTVAGLAHSSIVLLLLLLLDVMAMLLLLLVMAVIAVMSPVLCFADARLRYAAICGISGGDSGSRGGCY